MTEIQTTETSNERASAFVTPGFHAGRLWLRRSPGVEAGRYKVRISELSCFGHLKLKPWNLFRISNLVAAALLWVVGEDQSRI
jgi:hypothetical protein